MKSEFLNLETHRQKHYKNETQITFSNITFLLFELWTE